MAAPLSFGFKRSYKATDAVKRKEPKSNKVFISEFGEETEEESVSEELVIPRQENSFRPGVKNSFVPRFVPLVLSSKEQLNSEERFEAAEVKETTQEVHYGLQPRDGVFTSTASDFVSESELAEKEGLEAFRAEVRALPDEADGAAYERMPVEAFGLAMLRGMDWKEGQVLGKNKDKKAVEAIEFVPRASRLGLGAAPNGAKKKRGPIMVLPTGADGKVRHVRTLDEKLVPYEESEMKVGDQRRIASGDHQGFQCTIVKVTDSKGEVLVRLPNDEEIHVQLRDLIPIDRSIEDALAPPPVPKRKKQKREMNSAEGNGKTSWLMTGIRVRIVDKRLDNGQFYLKKGVIVDIIRPGVANVLLDHSHVLKESLKESSLETVVPRGDAAVVLVVKGEFQGSKGKLLQRNSDQEMATIQLLSDLSVHRMSFDYVSEYVQP